MTLNLDALGQNILSGNFKKAASNLKLQNIFSGVKSYVWIRGVGGGGWGHSCMSVDIKCLSIRPLFYADTTPNDPVFLNSVHTQWPPFFHFCIKFYIKIANFCTLCAHFEKFNDFVAILTENLQIFVLKLIFCTLNDSNFWETKPTKPPFFLVPTRNDPLFRQNLTPNAPYFLSPVGTCTSLSYLSAPRGVRILPILW